MDGKVYNGKKQKTVVEFICDAKERGQKRGLSTSLQVRDDEDGGEDVPKLQEEVDDGAGGKLKFINYDDVEKSKVLSLEWTTPYACENSKDGSEPSSSTGHWGFFTWLIIM